MRHLLESRFWISSESTIRESIGSVHTAAFIVIDLGRQTSFVSHLREGSFAAQSTFNCFLSSEIADQDDIAAGFAAREQQLLSIGRPIKIKDSARTKFGELMWPAAYHRLFP